MQGSWLKASQLEKMGTWTSANLRVEWLSKALEYTSISLIWQKRLKDCQVL